MLPQIFLPGFAANLFAINKSSSRTSQCQSSLPLVLNRILVESGPSSTAR
ncbi:unnamed protein product [Musa acuminata subsp. burmannicoides]